MTPFPPGFLFGAATSAFQVEGGSDGCDWADWERQPGRIHDGTRAGRAAGWWEGRAAEDLAWAAAQGQRAHRFGVEWSRLEPEPGRFDAAAFDRYRGWLEHLRALGMTSMVTLNHFTLPRWAAARGSWLDPELPARFARFAGECARRLEPVDLWLTLNEPMVLVYQGYLGREWPPGLGRPDAAIRAARALLAAHELGYRAVKSARPGARVGLVMNMPDFAPAGPRRRDRWAAAAQDWAFSRAFLGRVRGLDFVGLNYYGGYAVRFDPAAAATLFGRHEQEGNVRTAHTDWGRIAPEGLTRQLLRLSARGVPIYVTENGIYDNDDARRGAFVAAHVAAVAEAIARGADVRGYFAWSLVDNFEWAEGWATRFGLLALDRQTLARTPRPSAAVYAAICRE